MYQKLEEYLLEYIYRQPIVYGTDTGDRLPDFALEPRVINKNKMVRLGEERAISMPNFGAYYVLGGLSGFIFSGLGPLAAILLYKTHKRMSIKSRHEGQVLVYL